MKLLKNQKGFTFTEMLTCVVVLVLISLICTTGLGLAVRSQNAALFEANSQMLESTLDLIFGDMLRHAYSIEVDEDSEEVTAFYNEGYEVEGGRIDLKEGLFWLYPMETSSEDEAVLLVSKNVYAEELYVDSFRLTYDEENRLFEGSYTIKSNVIGDADRECSFSYRNIVTIPGS